MVAHLKLLIAKLRRERFGPSAERSRLIDQLEVPLEGLEANAPHDQTTGEKPPSPRAPFHVSARARAGPSLLATILSAKFGEHQPLNRQSESYAREGIDLDVSTLADWVGACTASLAPLVELIRRHVFAAERLHGDDTTVPVLAKGKTITGRVWVYVRDDRPFAGPGPPAVAFFYSRNRNGEHPARHLSGYAGILQADAYAGFGELYEAKHRPAPITEAACWSHGRRKFFVLADTAKGPVGLEGEPPHD